MNNDYEKRLSKAVEKLQEAQKQAKDALAEIDTAAGELLHRGAPALIEEQHADIVDATDHVKGVMSRFEVINIEARAAIVELGNVRKMANKVSFGMGKLFADTITAGEEERAHRQRRQTTIPGVDAPPPRASRRKAGPAEATIVADEAPKAPPLRMPRGLGFCTGILEEIDAELGSDGPPLDLEELGYRLAKRAGEGCGSEIGDMITAAAEDSDHPPALTDAERAAFEEGVRRAVTEMEAKEQGDVPPLRQAATAGADPAVLEALGNPNITMRDLGRGLAQRQYLIGDTAEHMEAPILAALGEAFQPNERELAELRAGIAQGVAAEEAKTRGEEPPGAQSYALKIHLQMARDLARKDAGRADGGRFRTAEELWTSAAFAPPAELEPQKAVLFVAYEESYEALRPELAPVRKQRGRPRKGASS